MLFTAVKKLIKVVRYNLWRILVNSFQLLNMEGIEKPQIITHIEKNLNYSLFDCKWIPCSAKFLVIGSQPKGTGTMEIYEIESGVAKQINVVSNPNAFKCCTFGASNLKDRHLATGDFLGNLELWNLENSVSIYAAKQHTDIINAIDGLGGTSNNCGAPEIVTGSRDGTVKVWDPRQKDKAVASMEPNPGEARRDCWTVGFGNSFNNTERIVCAGYDNGDIKMFDLRMMAVRWECNLKNGICSLEFDRKDIPMNKLVAATLEGKFHVFDTRTQHPKKGFAQVVENDQKNGTVWLCRHLPQNRDLFITCAGTGHIMLWKYSYPDQRSKSDATGETCGVAGTLSRLQKMSLSSQPINSLDWSPDKQGLAVCTSFDQTLRVIITTKLNLY